MMELARPWFLLLSAPVLAALWWQWRGRSAQAVLRHPNLELLEGAGSSLRVRLRARLGWLQALAMILLVVAAAGPRVAHQRESVKGRGIDIVLALDVSGSMRSLDFQPLDRLQSAKEVIRSFIAGRSHDRIGLVLFAARAFTQCPLTLDHPVLTRFLDEVEVGLIDDGTAIGLGLATAVSRLKHSDSPSRTVVLLTDGANNIPTLEPETAADLAHTLGVRVYTIAIGKEGLVPFPVDDPFFGRRTRQVESHLDLDLLRNIAQRTGGQMFQATNADMLKGVFATIDKLETARYETLVSTWYRELAGWFILPAILLLVMQSVLDVFWLRRLP